MPLFPAPMTAVAGALIMASYGFKVFRLAPNSKKPLGRGWPEATTDPAVIRAWGDDLFGRPDLNFAYCPVSYTHLTLPTIYSV